MERPETFDAFWPFYLREHARPTTRMLHFAGTTAAVATIVAAAVARRPGLLLLAPLCGYVPAWIGHFGVEKNRPATFEYPLWSLMADFRMWGHMLRGELWTEDLAGEDGLSRPDPR